MFPSPGLPSWLSQNHRGGRDFLEASCEKASLSHLPRGLLFPFFVWGIETESHVAQAGPNLLLGKDSLELLILLPLSPEF